MFFRSVGLLVLISCIIIFWIKALVPDANIPRPIEHQVSPSGATEQTVTSTKMKLADQGWQYSKHHCRVLSPGAGGTIKPCATKGPLSGFGRSCHPETVCRFENVCYDIATNTSSGPPYTAHLMYFAESLKTAPFGNATTFFERGFVELDVIAKPIPAQARIFRHEVTVLFDVFKCGNFGHNIRDAMFYAFLLQYIFGIVDFFDSQLLTLLDRRSARTFNTNPHCFALPALYGMLSRHPLMQLNSTDLIETHGGSHESVPREQRDLMCFRTLLVGSGSSQRIVWNSTGGWSFVSKQYFRYRNVMIHNVLGPSCADVACGLEQKRGSLILVLRKKFWTTGFSSGAGIVNAVQVTQHLMMRFPKYTVESWDLADLSLKRQFELAIQTVLMFTHYGGGSYIALYLPRNATCAVMNAKGAEEPLFFRQRFLWINTVFLPKSSRGPKGLFLHRGVAENITLAAIAQ